MSLLLPLMMMQQMLLPKKKPKLNYGAKTTPEARAQQFKHRLFGVRGSLCKIVHSEFLRNFAKLCDANQPPPFATCAPPLLIPRDFSSAF